MALQPSQLALQVGRHCGQERVSHSPGMGEAVTVSPWPTLWAPGPAAGEDGVIHGQEVGAAVTVSPWSTLWSPCPLRQVTHWGMRVWSRSSRHS